MTATVDISAWASVHQLQLSTLAERARIPLFAADADRQWDGVYPTAYVQKWDPKANCPPNRASSSTIQGATGPNLHRQQPRQAQPSAAAKLAKPGASRTESGEDAGSQNAGGSSPSTITAEPKAAQNTSVQNDDSSQSSEFTDMVDDHDGNTQPLSHRVPSALSGPSIKRTRQGKPGSPSRRRLSKLEARKSRQGDVQVMKGLAKRVVKYRKKQLDMKQARKQHEEELLASKKANQHVHPFIPPTSPPCFPALGDTTVRCQPQTPTSSSSSSPTCRFSARNWVQSKLSSS